MQKTQKLEKDFFSNWTDSKRIFDTEIDENEIQNCKSLEQNSVFLVFAAVNKISNVCKVHFVHNVLLSVHKGQVVHCAMEERKTDLILFIWLKIHSHVTMEFFNISH